MAAERITLYWVPAGPDDVEEKTPVTNVFEISMVTQFLVSASTGMMGGVQTSLPLIPEEDMQNFAKDYHEWAPAPWSTMPMPAGPFGMTLPGLSPAPIMRVMLAASPLGDLMQSLQSMSARGGDDIDISFVRVKSLIWHGMAPMTDAQWQAKGLDKPENIQEAMAVIGQAIDVFRYLRKPEIQGKMRSTHNKIWTEIDIFQDACIGLRTSRGEPRPNFSMTNLWDQFVRSHFEFMELQARAWIFKRLKILLTNFKTHFTVTFQSGRVISATQGTVRIDHYDMFVINQLLDTYIDADLLVTRPTEGFISRTGIVPALANIQSSEAERTQIYAHLESARISGLRSILQQVINERKSQRATSLMPNLPAFLNAPSDMIDREFAHNSIQPEIENPSPLKQELWVSHLASEKVVKFGFVIYRLSYAESDEAWEEFLKKLNDGLASGWEGVIGAADVRRKETFHWIDGRTAKIPEGDVKAARLHFQNFCKNPFFPPGLTKAVCLGITPNSVASFTETRPEDQRGDFRGFVNVMDPSFDPSKTPAASDGYEGVFKIIDLLIWTDLCARTSVIQGGVHEYWSLSTKHPWGVYVGPSTAVSRRRWKEMRGGAILGLWSTWKEGRGRG